MSGSRTGRTRDVLLAIYVVVCIAALVWPGYDWFGNRIEPFVLGVPFSLAWVAGWVLLTFVVLSVYHLSAPRERGRDGS
jgi:TRAP-type C4-dicarboxylate transport system permease small subunit